MRQSSSPTSSTRTARSTRSSTAAASHINSSFRIFRITPSSQRSRLQPDDKVLIGSSLGIEPGLWRFNADGSLDTSFGSGGRAWILLSYTSFPTDYTSGMINSINVLPSGKILCAGWTDVVHDNASQESDWFLERLDSNGIGDASFGSGSQGLTAGFVQTTVGFVQTTVNSGTGPQVALQSDGKIILGGAPDGVYGLEAVRYTDDGVLDPTFTNPTVPGLPSTGAGTAFESVSMALTPSAQPIFSAVEITNAENDTQENVLIRLQNDAPTGSPPASVTPTIPAPTPGELDSSFGAARPGHRE